ncbi:hypothetical protein LP417_10580 [Polaromonas sp. P1-6]|nr:hypothetical protein LP417_10580 [Polaromonas sp. P1-6]
MTSANPGKGADFGGLAGADAYCQKLATSANAGKKNWRAYLSTTASGPTAAVNARPHRPRPMAKRQGHGGGGQCG